jgi:hypothetical protein
MMIGAKRWVPLLTALLLLPVSGLAQSTDDDDFWATEEVEDEFISGTGSGAGPAMIRYEQDLDDVNRELGLAGLQTLPEKTLYWGGAAWVGIATGERFFVAIGGGGYGGSDRAATGGDVAEWSHGAGYLAIKGIYPLHRRLFLEGGVQLGGGSSSFYVEDRDAPSGLIRVHARGDRDFLLLRPQLGLDFRLARWVGVLVEGGYTLTSGDWSLEGDDALIGRLDFGDGNAPYFSVMVRFGI